MVSFWLRWRPDVVAGFLVFLIALPLSLGIAVASGFPPVAGILTAIVGGLLASPLGSAPLTIKGPAAGMIVIVAGAVAELGQGNDSVGYARALAVGVVAGLLQVVFSRLKAGSMAAMVPPGVVHGMMAAIGIIIIGKQVHTLLGVKVQAPEPWQSLALIPRSVGQAVPEVTLIGLGALLLLFGLPRLRLGWLKRVPLPMLVLLWGIAGALFFGFEHQHMVRGLGHAHLLGPTSLVTLPGTLLASLHAPDFSHILSGTSLKYIALYALVGSLESLLTVSAADALDARKRSSDANRDLLATGLANTAAAAIGGLPMISEVVRTRANIDAGAQSARANFTHGLLLLLAVGLVPGVLHLIPLSALAGLLIYTGVRLASPREFAHALNVGTDQLAMMAVTCIVTLATDLLIGVGSGLLLAFVLHASSGVGIRRLFGLQMQRSEVGEESRWRIEGPLTFLNLLTLQRALAQLSDTTRVLVVDLSRAPLVDHCALARLERIGEEWPQRELQIVGLEGHRRRGKHRLATHWLIA